MPGVPKTMRAAAIDRFGGPEELTLHTLPVPEIGPKELLIAVHTAGAASWDAEMRAGWCPPRERGSDRREERAARLSRCGLTFASGLV